MSADPVSSGSRLAWCLRTYAWLDRRLPAGGSPPSRCSSRRRRRLPGDRPRRRAGPHRRPGGPPPAGPGGVRRRARRAAVAEEADRGRTAPADWSPRSCPWWRPRTPSSSSCRPATPIRRPRPGWPTWRPAPSSMSSTVRRGRRRVRAPGGGDRARRSRSPRSGPPLRVAFGAVVGALLGFGADRAHRRAAAAGGHLGDVEDAVGVPLLGALQLPLVAPGATPEPLHVPGIAAVTRRLAAMPPGRLLLLSPRRPSPIRRLGLRVGRRGARRPLRRLRLEAPPRLLDAARERRDGLRDVRPDAEPEPDGAAGELVLVDGGVPVSEIDRPGADRSCRSSRSRPAGVSRRRLRLLAADYLGDELVGVVLVDVGTGRRRAARGRARTAVRARPSARQSRGALGAPDGS